MLEKAQVSHLRSESYYGLSLNLGGVELTMRELVGLYAMLVNEGVWHPIHLFKDDERNKVSRLLSPEASFLVLDMLKNTPRNDLSYKGFQITCIMENRDFFRLSRCMDNWYFWTLCFSSLDR